MRGFGGARHLVLTVRTLVYKIRATHRTDDASYRTPRKAVIRKALVCFLFMTCIAPLTARAEGIEVMPLLGYSWGGTQEFDIDSLGSGNIHLEAAVTYGLGVAMYGTRYGLDVMYHYQDTDAVVHFDGLFGFGPVDVPIPVGIHNVVAQILWQFPVGGFSPYLLGGLGAQGLTAEDIDSEWQFAMSLGGGVRKVFHNGGSLRLTVRMIAPLEWTDNGTSFGASDQGVKIGGDSSFFQGDVNLGYSFPVWRLN